MRIEQKILSVVIDKIFDSYEDRSIISDKDNVNLNRNYEYEDLDEDDYDQDDFLFEIEEDDDKIIVVTDYQDVEYRKSILEDFYNQSISNNSLDISKIDITFLLAILYYLKDKSKIMLNVNFLLSDKDLNILSLKIVQKDSINTFEDYVSTDIGDLIQGSFSTSIKYIVKKLILSDILYLDEDNEIIEKMESFAATGAIIRKWKQNRKERRKNRIKRRAERNKVKNKIANRKRSRAMKKVWRKNRRKYMKSFRRLYKSIVGKKLAKARGQMNKIFN